jgi:hypothetical protein
MAMRNLRYAALSVSTAGLIGLISVVDIQPARALVNGSFETGDFTDWQVLGDTSVVSSTTTQQGANILPTEGAYMALLTAGGASTSAVETFLGLASGSIAALQSNATAGSAIKQTFFATQGEVISIGWNFLANDYMPYNDFAFVSIGSATPMLLSDVQTVGDYGYGFNSYSFTIPTTGNYTLGAAVFNSGDNSASSQLAIDVPPTPVPVPANSAVSGLLIALGSGIRSIRKQLKKTAE